MISLTERQNAVLGVIGSSVEVAIQHPLMTIKNKFQQNKPIIYKPASLYKGVFINMSSLGIVTGAQFYLYKAIYKQTNLDMFSSLSAGLLTGLIASPAEMFIIQKHNFLNFSDMHKKLIGKHGLAKVYTRGIITCSTRESLYSSGMMTGTPVIEKYLNEWRGESLSNSFIASIISGTFFATVSHPLDTIKTLQQENYKYNFEPKHLFNRNLFSGLIPRVGRIIGTFFIINESNKHFYGFVKNTF